MSKQSAKKEINLGSELVFLASIIAVILILLITSLNLNFYLAQPTEEEKAAFNEARKVEALKKEKAFWHGFLNNSPTYLPGWAQLANIEWQIGNETEAFSALGEANEINPNSVLVKKMSSQFGLKSQL